MKDRQIWLLTAVLVLGCGFSAAQDAKDEMDRARARHHANADHHEHEDRGFLGVHLEISKYSDNQGDERNTVRIRKVIPGSGAAEAGLLDRDLIVAIDGKTIETAEDLHRSLHDLKPGRSITLTFERDGVEDDAVVILGDHPTGHDVGRWAMVMDEKRAFLGIHLQPLTSQLAEYFGVEKGVMVSEVIDESPAKTAGLMAGDILTAVNGKELDGEHSLHLALAEVQPGDQVELQLQRRGSALTLFVEAGSFKDQHRKIDIRRHKLHNIIRDGETIEIIVPDGEEIDHRIELHEHHGDN